MKEARIPAIIALILSVSVVSPAATYGGGSGTAESPYEIWTAEQMNTIGLNRDDWDKHFKLMADIDMAAYSGTQYNIIGLYDTTTHREVPFTGIFDGNHHKISHLTLNIDENNEVVGLFGLIENAEILNLGLDDISITSGGNWVYIGGLAGYSDGEDTVVNCYVTGSIYTAGSYGSVGGLVGRFTGRSSMSNCYAAVSVDGKDSLHKSAGGLIGENSGMLNACYSTGNVTGNSHNINSEGVGGLAGFNSGTITGCYSTSAVSGIGDYVGGLIGINNDGTITACYATGSVSGVSCVGGLTGVNGSSLGVSGIITACYATGSVSGDSYVGGFAGTNRNTISFCYATGLVSGDSFAGGFTGSAENEVDACFWDADTSAQDESGYGKGLSTEQMKTMSIYQNAGWADKGWVIEDGQDYPRLEWENTGGVPIPQPQALALTGSGTAEEPYLISTAEEFASLSWYSEALDKHFRLTTNLDLSGVSLYPIGVLGPFTGVFDGNGHTLSNAIIERSNTDFVGLFSVVSNQGVLQNLIVDNLLIRGRNYVGGLVGYIPSGTLRNCRIGGSIRGTESVGGLTGKSDASPLIRCGSAAAVSGILNVGGLAGENFGTPVNNCYSTGSVEGETRAGGLIGMNTGYIQDCYASGNVSGVSKIGGLVGYNYKIANISGGLIGNKWAYIDRCYAVGTVSGTSDTGGLIGDNSGYINDCFWDVQSSGQTVSDGGTGQTTDQMMLQSTFTASSWEFASVHSSGPWIMPQDSYPQLAWEIYSSCPIPDVRGLTVQEAQDLLAEADIPVYNTLVIYDPSLPAGLVVGTDLSAGENAYQGLMEVLLLVAKDIRYSGGEGTAESPYQIATVDNWYELGVTQEDWDKHFILTDNLDFRKYPAEQYKRIGYLQTIGTQQSYPFTGTLDGKGHIISNFSYRTSEYVDCGGLFGEIYQAVIANLGVENVNISCNGYYIGSLVGSSHSSSVSNCYSTGTVAGTGFVGGLLGGNSIGSIQFCSASNTIIADGIAGGLVGCHTGEIIDSCHASSRITADGVIGGLVGHVQLGRVVNSYATGKLIGSFDVGGFCGYLTAGSSYEDTGNFWNIETTGIDTSAMGTGLSTAQMQTRSTFADAGWDFETVWAICEGTNYPRLRWQIPAADWVCPDGVRSEDLAYLAARWMTADCGASEGCGGADLDADGAVGLSDLAAFVEAWLH